MRNFLFVLLGMAFFSSIGLAQKDDKSRYVLGLDTPIEYIFHNKQYSTTNRNLGIENEQSYALGINVFKYNPMKNNFIENSLYVNNRSLIFDENSYKVLNEFNIGYKLSYNHIFSKDKTLIFSNITNPFIGFGLDYSRCVTCSFEYLNNNNRISKFKGIIKSDRIFGILKFGILEDVFNITDKTPLSKFDILFRIPLGSLSNNLTLNNSFGKPELDHLVESDTERFSLEIRYGHLIDTKKNRYSSYTIKFEDKWAEVSDPLKTFFPPIVNNGSSKSNFFGNISYEIGFFNFKDSTTLIHLNEETKFKTNSINSAQIGYTLNFLGNYSKDYGKEEGVGIYNRDNVWRRNLYVTAGVGASYIRLSNNFIQTRFDNIHQFAFLRSGLMVRNNKTSINSLLGCTYYHDLNVTSFNNLRVANYLKSKYYSPFIALGYQNKYIKMEYNLLDGKISGVNNNFSISFLVGN